MKWPPHNNMSSGPYLELTVAAQLLPMREGAERTYPFPPINIDSLPQCMAYEVDRVDINDSRGYAITSFSKHPTLAMQLLMWLKYLLGITRYE